MPLRSALPLPFRPVTAFAQVNYVDGESEGVINMTTQERTAEFDRWGLAAAYEYPLSKRTKVYASPVITKVPSTRPARTIT